mgnify:FL=1
MSAPGQGSMELRKVHAAKISDIIFEQLKEAIIPFSPKS